MDTEDVTRQISEFLTEELGVPEQEVSPVADLRGDLGLDSLDLVELITVIEDRIGTRLDPDELERIRTVDDVTKVLVRILADPSRAVA